MKLITGIIAGLLLVFVGQSFARGLLADHYSLIGSDGYNESVIGHNLSNADCFEQLEATRLVRGSRVQYGCSSFALNNRLGACY